MDASDATGTPAGNRAACSSCVVPLEVSVTVPWSSTELPEVVIAVGASTVVWLEPLPRT